MTDAASEHDASAAVREPQDAEAEVRADAEVQTEAAPPEAGSTAETLADDELPWCPEEIETLPGPICAVVPEDVKTDRSPTLVIFLHGVTNVGSGWQIGLIKGMANYAKHQHFALLAPRAPRQPPVEGKPDMYAWRTSSLSEGGEQALLDGWKTARAQLESRIGRPFAKVFVMGFSSGAYYVSSLALRGRLDVDGYAAFAGGSAPYSPGMIGRVDKRVPIFVGYGLRDRAGSRDARGLVSALRRARWEHQVMALRRAGHTITTRQFTAALAYLRAQSRAAAQPAPGDPSAEVPPLRGDKRRGSKHRVKPRQW